MQWSEVRKTYPEQWLVIEALEAHTEDDQRLLERIAVVELCPDGPGAMQSYRQLHRQYPTREFYFVHTGREILDIKERQWLGVRMGYETTTER
jgi:hypothetical protein